MEEHVCPRSKLFKEGIAVKDVLKSWNESQVNGSVSSSWRHMVCPWVICKESGVQPSVRYISNLPLQGLLQMCTCSEPREVKYPEDISKSTLTFPTWVPTVELSPQLKNPYQKKRALWCHDYRIIHIQTPHLKAATTSISSGSFSLNYFIIPVI